MGITTAGSLFNGRYMYTHKTVRLGNHSVKKYNKKKYGVFINFVLYTNKDEQLVKSCIDRKGVKAVWEAKLLNADMALTIENGTLTSTF